MRAQLRDNGVSDAVVDDAVLILSELLSNACRHGRPLGQHVDVGDGDVRAAWRVDRRGGLTVEVTDGGGPTRPTPSTPSVTARGGRGLNIISALSEKWGVRDDAPGEVTVWALVAAEERPDEVEGLDGLDGLTRLNTGDGRPGLEGLPGFAGLPGFDGLSGFEDLDLDGLSALDDAS